MVGRALLTGLYMLKNHKLSNPYLPENGGPKNISLVLALFVDFAQSWHDIGGDHYGETAWVSKLGKLAKDNGIDIKGPYKFQERTEDLFEPVEQKEAVHNADSVDDDIEYSDDYSVKGWKEEVCPQIHPKHTTRLIMLGKFSSRPIQKVTPRTAVRQSVAHTTISPKCPRPRRGSSRVVVEVGVGLRFGLGLNDSNLNLFPNSLEMTLLERQFLKARTCISIIYILICIIGSLVSILKLLAS
jgi:hypothetical protein